MVSFQKKNTIFAQGDSTDGLFFIQKGKVQLSVVSEGGKEARWEFWARETSLEKEVSRASFRGCRAQLR